MDMTPTRIKADRPMIWARQGADGGTKYGYFPMFSRTQRGSLRQIGQGGIAG
jgi:hypothetical protein